MSQNSAAPSPFQSVVAGAVAGGVESLTTYPTEYVKTRKQLMQGSVSSMRLLVTGVKEHGIGVLYTGSIPFCISNAAKSGVRFLTFDMVRDRLPKDPKTGKPAKISNMLAGVAAGVAESVTVVTPGENLKTKIVEDRAGPRQFKSNAHAIRSILQDGGVRSLFRGVIPVTMKQSSNAVVRFTCYNAFLDTIQPVMKQAGYGMLSPTVAGAAAGVVTVFATMPFDSLKTQMQRLSSPNQKRGLWESLTAIVRSSGISGLWRGTTPRLVRLSVSGALSFSIYENVVSILPRMERARGEQLTTM